MSTRAPASATRSASCLRHAKRRRQAAGGLELRHCLAACPGPAQRERKLVVGLRVVGRKSYAFAKFLNRSDDLAALHHLESRMYREDRGLPVRLALVQPVRGGQRRGRASVVVPLPEDLRQARVRFGGRWAEPDRLSKLLDRAIGFSLLLLDRAEHVVGVGKIRAARDRLAEKRRRLFGAPGLPQHDAEGVRRFRQLSVEARRRSQRALGSGEVVALFQREAEVVKSFGTGRIA